MKRAAQITLAVLLAAAQAAPGVAAPAPQKQTEKQVQKKQQKVASLTGCVDQQDGQYVLIDDRSRNRVADLEADGFPVEGFAKHVGHKVTVRGTSIAGSTQALFKVRSIETVSDVCGPQHP
jgi:hypothetical protein